MIHVMLPVQYLRQADGRRMEPHKRLMLAVLQAVVDDCRRPLSRPPGAAGASAERRLSEEARAYVASTDRSWPFSFENLCDAIGLDAACLRRELAAPPAHHPSENERPAAGGVSRA
jgi:hypothetical protein